MPTQTCYRVQPIGLEIAGHRSETSNDELANGVHVFGCLQELCGGVRGWCSQQWAPEIIEITCDSRDLRDNGDFEGFLLRGSRGEITTRKSFADWDSLIEWASKYPESL